MTKQELIEKLKQIVTTNDREDFESSHMEADKALLEYINDPEVTEAFNSVERWY